MLFHNKMLKDPTILKRDIWFSIELENVDELRNSQASVCVFCSHAPLERIYNSIMNDGRYEIGQKLKERVRQSFQSNHAVYLCLYDVAYLNLPSSTLLGICQVIRMDKYGSNHVLVRFLSLSKVHDNRLFYDGDLILADTYKQILETVKRSLIQKKSIAVFPQIFVSLLVLCKFYPLQFNLVYFL